MGGIGSGRRPLIIDSKEKLAKFLQSHNKKMRKAMNERYSYESRRKWEKRWMRDEKRKIKEEKRREKGL